MPRSINIQTVKYQAEIETPTTYTGYLVDGKKSIPMSQGNRDYRAVQAWIAKGNSPELAFTQEELDAYTIYKQEAVDEAEYQVWLDAKNRREYENGKR